MKNFGICWFLFLICLSAEANQLNKPNILFIAIDDLRPELGCYGKNYIKSPNIDKLASMGAIFTNHYVQVPTCGASRFSLLTGMLPKTKAHLSNQACRDFIAGKSEAGSPETFIHHLRRNGYYTVGIGKISHYVDGYFMDTQILLVRNMSFLTAGMRCFLIMENGELAGMHFLGMQTEKTGKV